MKIPVLLYICLLFTLPSEVSANESGRGVDSLLLQLDEIVIDRDVYDRIKYQSINELKQQRQQLEPGVEAYRINEQIIDSYTSFLSDSTFRYIYENIRIGQQLKNSDLIIESQLRLAFNYSLSGLFLQANEIFEQICYNQLKTHHRLGYCWNKIRYFEQLRKYTNNPDLSKEYDDEIDRLRDTLLVLLPADSELYAKEMAFKLQRQGRLNSALEILMRAFKKEKPDTHNYAMNAMGIAMLYRQSGNRPQENHYLEVAALTDIKTAVKENEALLCLATNLFEQGDITRAYNYIHSALEDSNFYNSRFKSAVIAHVQPIIESNYLQRIEQQQRNLRVFVILLSILVFVMIGLFIVFWKQKNAIARSRESIREINWQLNDSQVIKEQYIGYFMNQCSVYINKLYLYRKDVNHKIKNGQIDQLYKPSTKELEKEIEELMKNFDEAFLNLYPEFVDKFNTLLLQDAQYKLEYKRLNTELRIFALMRLGITNVNQIAEFLHCSLQTIYNYKSKVKSKARPEIANIEDEVTKMRLTIPQPTTL